MFYLSFVFASTVDFLLLSCNHVMPSVELQPVISTLSCCLMRLKFSLPKGVDWSKDEGEFSTSMHSVCLLGVSSSLNQLSWLAPVDPHVEFHYSLVAAIVGEAVFNCLHAETWHASVCCPQSTLKYSKVACGKANRGMPSLCMQSVECCFYDNSSNKGASQ